jgi:hypothetical protein
MPDNIPMAFSLKPKADPGQVVGETFLRGRFENLIENIVLVRNHINALADELTPLRSRSPKQPLP